MTQSRATAPILVFGWGNPSRGDDALGPLLIEHLTDQGQYSQGSVEFLTDFQLQIEHALDLENRRCVLFIDASINCAEPFEVTTLTPARDKSFTTHAMSPQSVMQVFQDTQGMAPPPCLLLAIRGDQFELGQALSASAELNLAQALSWCQNWLKAEILTDQP